MFRIFDPYAMAISFLVGGVGFGMTFFFNTAVSEWGAQEILYPAMAMIYIYARNARFFESDEESATKILEGHGENNASNAATSAGAPSAGAKDTKTAESQKIQAPSPAGVPGLVVVSGPPPTAPEAGSLAVVLFFATWCVSCEKNLPSFLAKAARYSDEGVSFAGVTQEGEDDLRYFVETYQRPLRSVTFLADEQGVLTKGYQGAHETKTIPHCYIVRGTGGGDGEGGCGVVEWHGHPARLETALAYLMDDEDEEETGAESAVGDGVRA
ncbi:unnamed protein product [Pylaiella littoralis]